MHPFDYDRVKSADPQPNIGDGFPDKLNHFVIFVKVQRGLYEVRQRSIIHSKVSGCLRPVISGCRLVEQDRDETIRLSFSAKHSRVLG